MSKSGVEKSIRVYFPSTTYQNKVEAVGLAKGYKSMSAYLRELAKLDMEAYERTNGPVQTAPRPVVPEGVPMSLSVDKDDPEFKDTLKEDTKPAEPVRSIKDILADADVPPFEVSLEESLDDSDEKENAS